MRGQWLSQTRKLNKHYQSAGKIKYKYGVYNLSADLNDYLYYDGSRDLLYGTPIYMNRPFNNSTYYYPYSGTVYSRIIEQSGDRRYTIRITGGYNSEPYQCGFFNDNHPGGHQNIYPTGYESYFNKNKITSDQKLKIDISTDNVEFSPSGGGVYLDGEASICIVKKGQNYDIIQEIYYPIYVPVAILYCSGKSKRFFIEGKISDIISTYHEYTKTELEALGVATTAYYNQAFDITPSSQNSKYFGLVTNTPYGVEFTGLCVVWDENAPSWSGYCTSYAEALQYLQGDLPIYPSIALNAELENSTFYINTQLVSGTAEIKIGAE